MMLPDFKQKTNSQHAANYSHLDSFY